MDITTIKQTRISDEVFEQMKQNIIHGQWSPGIKIPGELDLVKSFGVSRVSVRAAIHRLVGMGILSIKRGEGTFVSEVLPRDYFNTLLPALLIDGASMFEILEFRSMVEIESAKLASRRADEYDVESMSEIIKKMEVSQGDIKKFAAEDLDFHSALAIATHNTVIIKVNEIIYDMLRKTMEEIVGLTGYEGGLFYHKRILKAIVEKDEKAAGEFMKEHIDVTVNKIKAVVTNIADDKADIDK
ncbi:MAG TPA: FadR/GntR family transcriptional regulator [Ruminiclostridium sp.]